MSDIARRLFEKTATVVFGSDGIQKNLFTLPKNARVLFFLVDINEAFNDSGTDLLKIGIASDDDYFAAAIDVSATGQVMVQQYQLGDIGSLVQVVTATYDGSNSDMTAGSLTVTCVYSHYKDR